MDRIVLGDGKIIITGKELSMEFQPDVVVPPDPPPVEDNNWSNPNAWPDKKVPVEGDKVVIPEGLTIFQDVNTAPLASLNVKGLLMPRRDAGNLILLTQTMHITGNGVVRVGEKERPFPKGNSFVTEIFGGRSAVDDHHDRGLMIHGNGAYEVFGDVSRNHRANLVGNVPAGARQIVVDDATGWQVGDELMVGTSYFYGNGGAERVKITAVNGPVISFEPELKHRRWGTVMYPTDNGLQAMPGAWTKKPHPDCPDESDRRAFVSNLTRNVVFQGPDDALWRDEGFGCQMMAMDRTNRTHFHGLRIRRCGQRGILGRYGYHRHENSWDVVNGVYLGEVARDDALLYRCVIDQSSQRGAVIHATDNTEIDQAVFADIEGHVWMSENGSERRNSIHGSAFFNVKGSIKPLQKHEEIRPQDSTDPWGASAIWHSNPDNDAYDNWFNHCEGTGWWGSFARQVWGSSAQSGKITMMPCHIPLGRVEDNRSVGCRGSAHVLNGAVTSKEGDVTEQVMYSPTKDETPTGETVFPVMKRMSGFFCNRGFYRHRNSFPTYQGWSSGHNYGLSFAGATSDAKGGDDAQILGLLDVGFYPDEPVRKPPAPLPYDDAVTGLRAGAAGYHSSLANHHNASFEFPMEIRPGMNGELAGGGVILGTDNYVRPVEMGTKRNKGNFLHNAFPFYLPLPPNLSGTDLAPYNRTHTLAGAVYDPGTMGGPEGSFRIYDDPFLSYNATILARPAPAGQNGLSVDGKYVGFLGFSTGFDNSPYQFLGESLTERLLMDGTRVGKWLVRQGRFDPQSGPFPWMRHWAGRVDPLTWYRQTFPGHAPSNWLACQIHCLQGAEILWQVPISTAAPIAEVVYMAGNDGVSAPFRRVCQPAPSFAAVRNGPGNLYWLDAPSKMITVKLVGNISYPFTFDPDSDGDLYKAYTFMMRNVAGVYGRLDS